MLSRHCQRRLNGKQTQKFDAIIVGAGQAGPPLAGRLTAAGQNVAVIERKLFGGTCVNTGCIPTKTLVASAHAAHWRAAAPNTASARGRVAVDMAKVKARKDRSCSTTAHGVESWLDGMDGCTLIRGHARFESPRTIRVDERGPRGRQASSSTSAAAAAVPDHAGAVRQSTI